MLPFDIKQKVGDLTGEELLNLLAQFFTPSDKSPPTQQEPVRQKLLNVKQAAELLGYKVATIYDKTHRRAIPFMKKGRKLWFSEADLLTWAESGRKETVKEISKNLHLKTKRK